jgi:hypothetical protein
MNTEKELDQKNHTLSAELQNYLSSLDGEDSNLGDMLEAISHRGFGLFLLLLALPAALPIPAPGYATPFGVIIIILALQMLVGRRTPSLPKKFKTKKLSHRVIAFSVKHGGRVLRLTEWLVRPRLSNLARSRAFLSLVSLVIILMAMFMVVPLPLTNTAPSFVIFILAAGMLEEDGLVLLGGLMVAPVAAAIGCLAAWFAVTKGIDAVEPAVHGAITSIKAIFGF